MIQIQPTIQHFTKILTNILQLKIKIIDKNLYHITETNTYKKFLNRQLNDNSHLLHHILKTKTKKIMTQSHFDPLYENYDNKKNYHKKTFLNTPIILQNRYIKIINLITITHKQQKHINNNLHKFSNYIHHISTIFISKLLKNQKPKNNINKIFTTIIDNINQNILIIDNKNQIQFINQTTLKTLNIIQNNIIKKPIHFKPLTFKNNFTHKHIQHIIS